MTTHELLAAMVHPDKVRLKQICVAVWPDFATRQEWEVRGLLGQVDDVLKGAAAPPWISQRERDRIEETAKAIPGPNGGFLYRWAGAASRADSPSVAELQLDGWTVEHVDPRYGTTLMRKATT